MKKRKRQYIIIKAGCIYQWGGVSLSNATHMDLRVWIKATVNHGKRKVRYI